MTYSGTKHFIVECDITSVHQQSTLFCLVLIPLVVGKEDYMEPIFIRFQMLAVPLGCHTDCPVISVIGSLPRFTFNKCLSGE